MKLRCRDIVVSLESPALMGVLNVTPDSFSDGGLFDDPDKAIARGVEMVHEGAAIVDVGGESTRPGAVAVEEAEELRRTIPVIEALVAELSVPISVDTRKPAVATAAIAAGASILNDTLGEDSDGAMDRIAAESGAALVIMHSRGTPQTMKTLTEYDDVVADVGGFLKRRAEEAEQRGVARDAIVIDPGIGFAKTASQSVALLRRVDELVDLGYPVLVGPSRKSFIGDKLELPLEDRLEATCAAVVWAAVKGARLARVHDVAQVARALRMIEVITHPDR